ncbi:Hypothetical protein SCF082_LOCUS46281 [Durusdinium trenchii]|uniref:TolA protein n=1 Tax=Durusdinium trenchii TaxID=1381693 RepID=A0ABP0RDY1_9DINO
MISGEAVLETPPPRENKRKESSQATPPGQRAPKRGRRKEAEELALTASKLESEAEEMSQEAIACEKAAVEAMERAQSLQAKATALAKRAEVAKAAAQEARQKAERAEQSTTKEGRDALKAWTATEVQDKAEKQAAKEAEKARKQTEKEEGAEARSVIKNIGSVSFKNVKFGIFKQLFSRGRCSYVPENFCPSDASIVVTSKDAAGIFGATKVRGGSMYATFVISSLRANYIPATGQLSISYDTDMGF